MMQTIGLAWLREAASGLDGMNWKRGKAVFRKRVKTKLETSLENAGVDLSTSLGSTLMEALISHGLSDYSLVLDDEFKFWDGSRSLYRFDTEDLEEWVGDVELKNDGKVRVSTRGIDKNGNALPWEHIEIYSNHDLFGKPL